MKQIQIPTINLNFIRTFVVVGQSKSITEATKKLNIDRSNISRNISNLEKAYGTKLFNISSQKFELTEDGKELFEGFEKAYNLLYITEKNFLQNKDLNNGKLTIGVSKDVENDIVIDKIKKFKSKYPNVVIKFVNSSTNDLYDKLSKFSMDFIIDTIIDVDQTSKKIEVQNINVDTFCIAYSKKHYNLNINSLKDLDNLPLILPITAKKERYDFNSLLKKQNIEMNLSLEVNSYDSILEYVKSGLGFGLLPKRFALKDKDILTFDIDLKKDISIAFIRENISPSAKELLKEFNVKDID